MKVTQHIERASGKTLFSIEVLPPLKGDNIKSLFDNLDPLMEFKPPFVDVTYHREEYVFKKKPDGLLEKISTRKRPGTVGICAAIQNHYKVDTVPHIICGGFSKEETENALIDLQFLGIDNVLVLQGDGIKNEGRFVPDPQGHAYASELVTQVVNMNKGIYLDEDLTHPHPSDFCIGVAGYPEKHFAAPNLQSDLKYLKHKVDQGAEYIVTQMFFDNKKYYVLDFTHYQTKQKKMMAHIIYCDEQKEMYRVIAFPKMYTTALGKMKAGSFCSPTVGQLDDGTKYVKDIA